MMVDGAMEGLKLQLLEPDKALDIMIEAKPELKTRPRNVWLIHTGNTNALSLGPAVKDHGLGYMLPDDQKRTRDVVIKYMEAKNVPPGRQAVHQQVRGQHQAVGERVGNGGQEQRQVRSEQGLTGARPAP